MQVGATRRCWSLCSLGNKGMMAGITACKWSPAIQTTENEGTSDERPLAVWKVFNGCGSCNVTKSLIRSHWHFMVRNPDLLAAIFLQVLTVMLLLVPGLRAPLDEQDRRRRMLKPVNLGQGLLEAPEANTDCQGHVEFPGFADMGMPRVCKCEALSYPGPSNHNTV